LLSAHQHFYPSKKGQKGRVNSSIKMSKEGLASTIHRKAKLTSRIGLKFVPKDTRLESTFQKPPYITAEQLLKGIPVPDMNQRLLQLISEGNNEEENTLLNIIVNDQRLEKNVCFSGKVDYMEVDLKLEGPKVVQAKLQAIPSQVLYQINTCQKDIYAVYLGIVVGQNAHANILLFYTDTKEFERFEPHGQTSFASPSINAAVDFLLSHASELKNFKYVSPREFCPLLGPQSKEFQSEKAQQYKTGLCAYWSFLYFHLRVLNSQYTSTYVVNELTKTRSPEQLFALILRYVFLIDSLPYINRPVSVSEPTFSFQFQTE
jgi:hypothetical protein